MSEPQPNSQNHRHEPQVHRITEARESHRAEQNTRVKKYTISMSVRMVCFLAAFVTHGWVQWVCFAGAVVLPYVAVVIANGGADLTKREPLAEFYAGEDPRLLTASPEASAQSAQADETRETGGFTDNYGGSSPETYPQDAPETIDGAFVSYPTEDQEPSTKTASSAPDTEDPR